MTLFPRTLLGRTVIVIAAVMIVAQGAAIQLFRAYNRGPILQEMAAIVTGQLRTIGAALATLPEAERQDFLDILEDSEGIRVVPDIAGELPSNVPNSALLQDFAEYLRSELGGATEFFVREQGGEALWVRLEAGGTNYWVSIPRKQIERSPPWLWFGYMGFAALLVLSAAYLLVWRVNRPLRALASAARALGAGKAPSRLEEKGPSEVSEMSRAFNQMASDIATHNAERALLLAGVSHDLRTPLTRLRVSLDIADAVPRDLHEGMVQDIDEIDAIIGQFLDFARAAHDEPVVSVNIDALVDAAVKRHAALGRMVRAELAPLGELPLRPLSIQRLIENLISNAVKYAGGEVVVRTHRSGDRPALSVLDRGPGIPAHEVERMKLPFTRLEGARSGGGHAGLGLAIVDRIAAIHGASFDLLARDGGGLEARVVFPAPRA